jgi:hypothetical protein
MQIAEAVSRSRRPRFASETNEKELEHSLQYYAGIAERLIRYLHDMQASDSDAAFRRRVAGAHEKLFCASP